MKPKHDEFNTELTEILDALLVKDVSITAREVARHHSTLRTASSFTRSSGRMAMITNAQARQQKLRTTLNPHFVQSTSLRDKLVQADANIALLESQVKGLVASHAACIQAVMKAGGLLALERFWKDYKVIGETVGTVSAYPERAEVIALEASKKRRRRPGAT
jgi:hypothetical protein